MGIAGLGAAITTSPGSGSRNCGCGGWLGSVGCGLGDYRLWSGVCLRRRRRGLRRRRRWLGVWLRCRHGLGLLARMGLLLLGLRLALTVTGAGILVDKMLDHEQRRRPVVELFAPVRADIDAHPAAGRAGAFGLGQLVMPGLAGQVVRQTAATVWPAPPLGLRRRCRLGRRFGGRVLARGHLREQQQLVGVEALAARPIQAAQQQVDPVPHRLVVAIALVQRGQQFQDHALERGHVVGQLLGGGRRQASSSGVREAHANNDVLRTGFVPSAGKKKAGGTGRPPAQPGNPRSPLNPSPSPAGGSASTAWRFANRRRPAAWPIRRHAR